MEILIIILVLYSLLIGWLSCFFIRPFDTRTSIINFSTSIILTFLGGTLLISLKGAQAILNCWNLQTLFIAVGGAIFILLTILLRRKKHKYA